MNKTSQADLEMVSMSQVEEPFSDAAPGLGGLGKIMIVRCWRTTVDSDWRNAILWLLSSVGGVRMLGLLISLEHKRRALRRRLMGSSSEQGYGYFAIAAALFFLFMIPPITGIELPAIAILVIGSLVVLPLAPVLL